MTVSFFTKAPATKIWKSVIGVSSAGAKRGRGKGYARTLTKDFNRGQLIGVGRTKMTLGGLNTQVLKAGKVTKLQELGKNAQFDARVQEERDKMVGFRKFIQSPLDRGWSGKRSHGKSAGRPVSNEAEEEDLFEGFDSTIVMSRFVHKMSGIHGRTRISQAMVVVGNGNGLAGFGFARGKYGQPVVRHARDIAAKQLVYIPRWENHTVLHDFHSKYYDTLVFVERKPRGYGLECQRVIEAICKHFGITDLKVTTRNSSNTINLVKAFFVGLVNQRPYQQMADEKKLHLVDMRNETFNYPMVLASPSSGLPILTEDQIKANKNELDFTFYINEGRIRLTKPPFRPKHIDGPTYYKYLDKIDQFGGREQAKLEMAAKYGNKEVLDVFPYFKTNAKAFHRDQESE